jgi:2-isopropylmalate synthase
MTMKAAEFGIELDDREAGVLSEQLKQLEAEGFVFEAADASLELLMRASTGWKQEYFSVESYRVTAIHEEVPQTETEQLTKVTTEATVKLAIKGKPLASVGEGNGPVNALDAALRSALNPSYPALERIHLIDFKVRVLDSTADTGAVTRVLIDSTNGDDTWTTIGVSPNIIEASWMALIDAVVFGLLLAGS